MVATYPIVRMRRLRRTEAVRQLVRETSLSPQDFIYPMFVMHGKGVRQEISAMPGCYHLSPDEAVREAKEVQSLGIPAVLLFGIPAAKDGAGSEAYADNGIVQE